MRERAAQELSPEMGRMGAEDPPTAFSAEPPNAGARLQRLLAWMERQDFHTLIDSGLLPRVEAIVVETHRRLYQTQGREWSRPEAYRWLRYEDPAPVERLVEGTRKLRRRGAAFDSHAVDKACVEASKNGYLN
jgi:hypothetical protein